MSGQKVIVLWQYMFLSVVAPPCIKLENNTPHLSQAPGAQLGMVCQLSRENQNEAYRPSCF